jgi:hypothetical protein
MLLAFLVASIGLCSLLAAWILPMLSDHLPHRFQIVLLMGGLALTLVGASLWVRA